MEVDGTTPLIGPDGPVTLLDVFEGRRDCVPFAGVRFLPEA
jgi:hypothetical protein